MRRSTIIARCRRVKSKLTGLCAAAVTIVYACMPRPTDRTRRMERVYRTADRFGQLSIHIEAVSRFLDRRTRGPIQSRAKPMVWRIVCFAGQLPIFIEGYAIAFETWLLAVTMRRLISKKEALRLLREE